MTASADELATILRGVRTPPGVEVRRIRVLPTLVPVAFFSFATW